MREGAPGTPNGVEGPALPAEHATFGEAFVDCGEGGVRVEIRTVDDFLRAQCIGPARLGHTIEDRRQFKAGTTQIAHHPVRGRHPGHQAEGGVIGLFLTLQHPHLETGQLGDFLDEGRTVGRVAYGGGGDGIAFPHALGVEQALEALEGAQGNVPAFRMQLAGDADPAAQPGHHLLVEDRPERPSLDAEMHQAHRVGADIDDRDVAVDGGFRDQRLDGSGIVQNGQLPDWPMRTGGWSFLKA